MIPEAGSDLQTGFVVVQQPSKTFRLDFSAGRVFGLADDLEAVKQAVFLALSTDRFAYEIFSLQYGNELKTLLGTPAPLVYAQIKQAIEEALLADDRISSVTDFIFSKKKGAVSVSFTCVTALGKFEEEIEVAA